MELKINSKKYKEEQENIFKEALKSEEYKALVKKLKITKEMAKNNTIKLLDSLEELTHCKNCNCLYDCENKVKGYVYFPEIK